MEDKFKLEIVRDNFNSALCEEDDVKLQYYLNSFEEWNKFFSLMGTIFGFVSNDLVAKMKTLNEFLKNQETAAHFETVKTMIEYEKKNGLFHKKGYTSGSTTLLRLHRGLDFIRLFLMRIGELDDEQSTSPVCKTSYDETLAKYHPAVIRTGAKLAMYTLPTKQKLLIKVCGSDEAIKNALEILEDTLAVTKNVYDRIETMYTLYDLHRL